MKQNEEEEKKEKEEEEEEEEEERDTSSLTLSLNHLQGLFIILLCGNGLSLIIFIFERITNQPNLTTT